MSTPAGDIEILFEDDHLIAVVKPAGLPTANAARGQESLFTILQQRRGSGAFVGIVSRLDAVVSGTPSNVVGLPLELVRDMLARIQRAR